MRDKNLAILGWTYDQCGGRHDAIIDMVNLVNLFRVNHTPMDEPQN